MEKRLVPEEKKATFDPQSGEVEPAPSEMEGARVMANEADEEIEAKTALHEQDVRRRAEEHVTRRGADTENFKAEVLKDAPRRR